MIEIKEKRVVGLYKGDEEIILSWSKDSLVYGGNKTGAWLWDDGSHILWDDGGIILLGGDEGEK